MTRNRTVVALDATADLCSVAWSDGVNWIERSESAGQRHSALIIAMVESTLLEAGADLAGPVSYTHPDAADE